MCVLRGAAVAGVVLAGGRSRRMGRTKALVEVDGRPMAERVLDALYAGGCSPLAIVGGDPGELAPLSAPVWPDAHPDAGPVGGIAHALRRCSERDAETDNKARTGRRLDAVVIVPCDLPWLSAAVVEQLVVGLVRASDADVCVARTDRLEPLVAIWRVGAVRRVERAFESGVRAAHELLGRVRVVAVPVEPATVKNVNSPGDLSAETG